MTLSTAEREFIRSLPKRYTGCALLQAAKDKSLKAALLNTYSLVFPVGPGVLGYSEQAQLMTELAMQVVKGQR